MNELEKRRERREQRRLERLGTDKPICLCGETDSRCFDSHHIAGRAFDPTETPLCKNCHAKASDVQKDHPRQVSDPPHPLERIGHFLHGLADLLALAIARLREFGNELINEARKAVRKTTRRGRRKEA